MSARGRRTVWAWRGIRAGILLTLAGACWPVAVHPQDLEVVAQASQMTLPPGYWVRVAADPLAFELPNGFFGRREALPPVRLPGLVAQPAGAPFEGVARFPVILALFADSQEPWVTPEAVAASLFTGPAPRGTLSEYYSEASYGRFTVEGTVSPWVRSSLSRSQVVGTQYGLGDDSRVGEYLVEALDLMDEALDFRLYDNDGPDGVPDSGDDDGVADLVTFEFLEVAASCGGPGIWPHRSGIAGWRDGEPWSSQDTGADGTPIRVNAYIIQGVTDCSGTAIQSAATIAHEFGHALGLPDYYHPVGGITPENRRWVLGCWDLMAAGSWGCGPVGSTRSDFGPTHMSAWNRHRLGWLAFQEVGIVRDTVLEIGPIRTTGDALKVPIGDPGEGAMLLVEYRDQGGFDRDVPAAGVLVTRIDPGGALRPESGYRYYASVLEADGNRGLMRVLSEGGDRGAPGDVFGVGADRLNLLSNPSTATGAGGPTSVSFHDFVLSGGGAAIRMSTDPEPTLVEPQGPVTTSAGVQVDLHTLLVAGGTLPVSVVPGSVLPPGLVLAADQDRLRLMGVPLAEGTFLVDVTVRDRNGLEASGSLRIDVGPLSMDAARLAEAILGGASVTDGEATYLDANGNQNGNLDLGDMRAWRYRAGG